MWIDFESKGPFAVKVYVGGVNAISGEPAIETELTAMRRHELFKQQKSVQDYLVTPKQLWLGRLKFLCRSPQPKNRALTHLLSPKTELPTQMDASNNSLLCQSAPDIP